VSAEDITFERTTAGADLDRIAMLEGASFSNPWTRDVLHRHVTSSAVVRVYVGRSHAGDGDIVAFCLCWVVADELHINTIAVAPSRRRQGSAAKLMAFVMAEAATAGATRATLEVRRSNEAARALYRGLGFVETHVRPQYYEQPVEDGLILWKEGLSASRP
jgi:ribosomal-protein-alanine N-acetyltransferase